MYTKNDLLCSLRAMGICASDTLLVHSSYKSLGQVEGGPDTVLDALSELVEDGMLIFPTHTWDKIGPDTPFDPESSASCCGILSEMFRKRAGVVRSLHYSHSVAVKGKRAAEFAAGEETALTPAPRNGCWGRLYDEDAWLLFLGCGIRYNTFLHSIEEWEDIPDRLGKPFKVDTIMPDGRVLTRHVQGHWSSFGDVSATFGKLELPLLQKKLVKFGYVGDAPSFLMRARDVADLTVEFLRKDPNLFGKWDQIPNEWFR
ncbi:MAG: AAC(3) family N-acetyltransferase [Oscillospiraceae bacterium]|nr:AAC(3) family N-acetyltransferase [Oscillospiraceae bacterium]